jgi:hypothetical protein
MHLKPTTELDAGTTTFTSGLLPELIELLRRSRPGDLAARPRPVDMAWVRLLVAPAGIAAGAESAAQRAEAATRQNVAAIRLPARSVPSNDPATFELPPPRRR